jgi:hypothetical protein
MFYSDLSHFYKQSGSAYRIIIEESGNLSQVLIEVWYTRSKGSVESMWEPFGTFGGTTCSNGWSKVLHAVMVEESSKVGRDDNQTRGSSLCIKDTQYAPVLVF